MGKKIEAIASRAAHPGLAGVRPRGIDVARGDPRWRRTRSPLSPDRGIEPAEAIPAGSGGDPPWPRSPGSTRPEVGIEGREVGSHVHRAARRTSRAAARAAGPDFGDRRGAGAAAAADGAKGAGAGGVGRRRGVASETMTALKARVKNGRLTLDEPTELREGEVVELVPLGEVLACGGDHLDAEERERLHAAIARGIADADAGRTEPAWAVLARLGAPSSR